MKLTTFHCCIKSTKNSSVQLKCVTVSQKNLKLRFRYFQVKKGSFMYTNDFFGKSGWKVESLA